MTEVPIVAPEPAAPIIPAHATRARRPERGVAGPACDRPSFALSI